MDRKEDPSRGWKGPLLAGLDLIFAGYLIVTSISRLEGKKTSSPYVLQPQITVDGTTTDVYTRNAALNGLPRDVRADLYLMEGQAEKLLVKAFGPEKDTGAVAGLERLIGRRDSLLAPYNITSEWRYHDADNYGNPATLTFNYR